ncbi:hypothetical protein H8959_007627 [Pygathrix nigripes]
MLTLPLAATAGPARGKRRAEKSVLPEALGPGAEAAAAQRGQIGSLSCCRGCRDRPLRGSNSEAPAAQGGAFCLRAPRPSPWSALHPATPAEGGSSAGSHRPGASVVCRSASSHGARAAWQFRARGAGSLLEWSARRRPRGFRLPAERGPDRARGPLARRGSRVACRGVRGEDGCPHPEAILPHPGETAHQLHPTGPGKLFRLELCSLPHSRDGKLWRQMGTKVAAAPQNPLRSQADEVVGKARETTVLIVPNKKNNGCHYLQSRGQVSVKAAMEMSSSCHCSLAAKLCRLDERAFRGVNRD